MENSPAYKFLAVTNKQYFDEIIALLYAKIRIDIKSIIDIPVTHNFTAFEKPIVKLATDYMLKKEESGNDYLMIALKPDNTFQVIKTVCCAGKLSGKRKKIRYVIILLGYEEKVIALFAKVLMDYKYPRKTISPSIVDKRLKKINKLSDSLREEIFELEKINNKRFWEPPNIEDFFVHSSILTSKYECIDKKEIFHGKRANAQYHQKLLIFSFANLMINNKAINKTGAFYKERDVLKIMMKCLEFNPPFTNPMKKEHVKNAIEDVINGLKRNQLISNDHKPIKDFLSRVLKAKNNDG